MEIKYINTITVEDWNMLREAVGSKPIHSEQVNNSINGSAFIATALYGDKIVGTGRLIWDGGYIAVTKNVMVLPEYQSKGIGSEIMRQQISFLKSQLKPGFGIAHQFIASNNAEKFYKKLGFSVTPCGDRGLWIEMYIRQNNFETR